MFQLLGIPKINNLNFAIKMLVPDITTLYVVFVLRRLKLKRGYLPYLIFLDYMENVHLSSLIGGREQGEEGQRM